MRKFVLFSAMILLSATHAVSADTPAGNVKSVGKVASFPVRHPIETLRGFLFAFVKSAGTVVDVAERSAAAIHAGLNKVDETVDKIEDVVKPVLAPPAPAPVVPAASSAASASASYVVVPGCSPLARAFVPKGCYSQLTAEITEIRCPGHTDKFRCVKDAPAAP